MLIFWMSKQIGRRVPFQICSIKVRVETYKSEAESPRHNILIRIIKVQIKLL